MQSVHLDAAALGFGIQGETLAMAMDTRFIHDLTRRI